MKMVNGYGLAILWGMREERTMYILYHKELYIVQEPLHKNRTCQTWRGKQIAMSEDRQALEEYIKTLPQSERYYIEKQPR